MQSTEREKIKFLLCPWLAGTQTNWESEDRVKLADTGELPRVFELRRANTGGVLSQALCEVHYLNSFSLLAVPSFTDEEMEAQTRRMTCRATHRKGQAWGSN